MLKVNDLIEFTNIVTNKKILVEIINLYKFANFDELYANFSKIAIGYDENEVANPKDMEEYYNISEQEKYGVVGIELKLKKIL